MRKEQFKRPEPGFSIYEGRTRGKRIKYTFSDEEDIFSDSTGHRHSTRNTGTNTPAETGPVTTSSGRQIRAPSRLNAPMGDSAPGSVQSDTPEGEKESSVGPTGRPRRSAAVTQDANGWTESKTGSHRNASADSDEESEAEFGDDEDDADAQIPEESEEEDDFNEDEAMVDDDLDDQPRSLIVKLAITAPTLKRVLTPNDQASNILPKPDNKDCKMSTDKSDGKLMDMADAPSPNHETISKKETEVTLTPTSDNKDRGRDINMGAVSHAIENQLSISPPAPSTSLAFRGSPEKQTT